MPLDLFDPAAYRSVRQPAMAAEMLPPECYTSPEFYARERDAVFGRNWFFLGHGGRIAAPGDYFTTEVAGAPVIIVRDRDGAVRGFANACRHRGCRVVQGEGSTRAFKCPYHGWVYGLDGALKGAPQMDFTEAFAREDHALVPVRVEDWGGLIFANLDPAAEDLRSYASPLLDWLEVYRPGEMVLTRTRTIDLPCNWKVYYENLLEPYHTPYVHTSGMAQKNEDEGARIMSGNGSIPFGEGGPDAPIRIEDGRNFGALIGRHAGSRGLLPGDEPLPPMPGLTGFAAEGSIWCWIYPCAAFSWQREGMWYNQIEPTGPETCRLTLGSCFPKATTERDDFAERAKAYYKRLDVTANEDVAIIREQQAGLRSPLARPGRLSHLERMVHCHRNWVLDQVLAP